MNDFAENQRQGCESIRFPQCPRCHTKIRHCQRYKSIINRIQSLIEQIKRMQPNEIPFKQLIEQRDQFKHSIEDAFDKIKIFDEKAMMIFTRRLNGKMNINELNYLKNVAEFFREIK